MTGELVTTEMFQEIPVRVIQTEKGPVVPVIDIARAIDVDRKNLTYLMTAHKELFKGVSLVCPLQTHGGIQSVICLTRDGMMGLVMKVQPSRANSKEAKEKIVAFQRWAIETLGKVMDGQINIAGASNIGSPTAAILEEHLRMARALTEYAGVKPGIASAVAISVVQEKTGQDLTWCRNLLPPAQGETGRMIPTEIGVRLGITPRQVNLLLENLKYQVRDGDGWRIYGAGRFWGEEYPYSRNGHSGYQIKWKPEIIVKIETVLHRTRQLQTGLLLGEMGS